MGCDGTNGTAPSGTTDETAGVDSETETTVPPCERLFGAPSEQTGLDDAHCSPVCSCDGDEFSPPPYSEDEIEKMRTMVLSNPPEVPTEDPYLSPDAAQAPSDAVCAVLLDPEAPTAYLLESFDTQSAAEAEGAMVTHTGACGLCSSLTDLAVYIEIPDLTEPVRTCGIKGVLQGEQVNMDCLTALGFTLPCARIWYYNTQNTRTRCGDICTELLAAPYHAPDGALNECLQCDEDNSGPVFKSVAGRTRRNSGIPSGICRPCDTLARIVHDYR